MPTCGNCRKEVAPSDVTCPHCGVLLAAYASPIGSGPAATYQAPPPPPSAEIPSVDMEVKPPSEADVVTDPTQVAEEAVSTAPRPLFDTYLTVEEIARAAEGDHAEDVVTIADKKVPTKPVEFDVPDYAKPPADAAPIPTIEEDDASIPLITRDDGAAVKGGKTSPSQEVANDPPHSVEEWLHAPQPEVSPNPKGTTVAEPAAGSEPVGTTDAYLRKIHAQTGYTPTEGAISKPVEERRLTPAERAANRRRNRDIRQTYSQTASEESVKIGGTTLYVLVLALLWFSTIVMMISGTFNAFLIFITIAATWGFGPVRRFMDEMRDT